MSEGVSRGPDASFAAETDDDLVLYMSWHGDDPDRACGALAEFYRRHADYLHGVCSTAYRTTLRTEGVKDLVLDTQERAGTFRRSGLADPERMRRRVRGWLGAIARNLAMDTLRARANQREEPLTQEHLDNIPSKGNRAESSAEVLLVREGLATVLSDREQEVLRLTMHYYEPERPHQRLPDAVAADLAKHLGTTSDNLRKIRSAALQKMKRFLLPATSGPTLSR